MFTLRIRLQRFGSRFSAHGGCNPGGPGLEFGSAPDGYGRGHLERHRLFGYRSPSSHDHSAPQRPGPGGRWRFRFPIPSYNLAELYDPATGRWTATGFLANQFRLLLHTVAYCLFWLMRHHLRGTGTGHGPSQYLTSQAVEDRAPHPGDQPPYLGAPGFGLSLPRPLDRAVAKPPGQPRLIPPSPVVVLNPAG